jgi:ParB/RepB/Spo0J family partition protein
MTTKTTTKKRKTARPAAGHWRCELCAEDHPLTENVCILGGFSPELMEPDLAIAELLAQDQLQMPRWNALRRNGANNDDIVQAIRAALKEFLLSYMHATDHLTALWDGDAVADGELIEVWLLDAGEQKTFDPNEWQRPERSPDFDQPKLVSLTRWLFSIPVPGEAFRTVDPVEETNGSKGETNPPKAETSRLTHGPKRKAEPKAENEKKPKSKDGLLDLPVGSIVVVDGANPRKSFDQEAHEKLVASIKLDGIISPLSVRPGAKAGTFELLAGERRLRAAKGAGLTHVPVILKSIDDQAAARIRLAENYIREGLNPIEEAAAFQELLDAHGFSQRELAEYFDLSQGKIGNSVRLLKLPDVWRKRVISREITATQARELATFADVPAVLEMLDQRLKKDFKEAKPGESIAPELWGEQFDNAVDSASRPMQGGFYDYDDKRHVSVALSKKDRERADLDIREIPTWNGTERRAFNVPLWKELQAAGEARRKTTAAKKTADDDSPAGGDKKLTAAEKREAAKKKAEQFARRLETWYHGWLQKLIMARLQELDVVADLDRYLKIALYFAVQSEGSARADDLVAAVTGCGGKRHVAQSWQSQSGNAWKSLDSLKSLSDVRAVLRETVRAWCAHELESYRADLKSDAVRGIAADLGISLETDWKVSKDFLELHTKDQLIALAKEWKVWSPVLDSFKRTELINQLFSVPFAKAPVPKDLAKLVKGLK